jgi:uncharacterized protein YgfB (UPF0149 family)
MNYGYVDKIRHEAGISINLPEYHGKISACLCCESITAEALLPNEINTDDISLSPEIMKLKNVLLTMISETLEKLNDTEMTFYPLLSPDSESLIERTLSLSNWCQGFVDGFGFSIVKKNISIDKAELEIIREIIEDFSQISKLTSASIMNEGGEDLAYMEVVEYVRIATQLIFEEMKVAKT